MYFWLNIEICGKNNNPAAITYYQNLNIRYSLLFEKVQLKIKKYPLWVNHHRQQPQHKPKKNGNQFLQVVSVVFGSFKDNGRRNMKKDAYRYR